MNTQHTPASRTVAPPRRSLARLVGRVVTCEARYSNVAKQLGDGRWTYHCTDVHVYPSASCEHVWIADLPMSARRQLHEGTRFTFQGEVYSYTREDGSSDYGIRWAGGLRVNKS